MPKNSLKTLGRRLLHTFRGKLALLYITVELSILTIAALLIYFFLSQQVYNNLDDYLSQNGNILSDQLEASHSRFWPLHLHKFTRNFPGSVQLIAANGMVLFTSGENLIGKGGNQVSFALSQAFRGQEETFISTRSLLNSGNLRVFSKPIHQNDRLVAVLLISQSTHEIQTFFQSLYLLGGILGLISIIISAWAGYVMANRALRPINEINEVTRVVASGDLSRRLKSRTDETEIRELVHNLNRMFSALEASFIAQKRFTADASHELRIPLTILKGDMEVALRHPRNADEYKSILSQSLSNIERMERIVNDLLTLARADAGTLEFVQEPIDLSLLLQEVGQNHLMLFANHHLMLEMDITDDIEIMGDYGHIERVFFNLLNNAYKHAPEHSTIYLSARCDGDVVHIDVRDDGPGIDEAHQALLFDRFYRADDSRVRIDGEGAGLGLAICKRIVEGHAGTIRVKSIPGQGATFSVTLPLSSQNPEHSQRLYHMLKNV